MNREIKRLKLRQEIAECRKEIAERELKIMDLEDEEINEVVIELENTEGIPTLFSYPKSCRNQLPIIHNIRENGVFEIGNNQISEKWDIYTIYEIEGNLSKMDGSLKDWNKIGNRLGITGQWARVLGYGIEIGYFDTWKRKFESYPLKYQQGQLIRGA